MARFFDLDLLHTLAVIAEAGSLSAAAPRLCRSQSAVSEQVRKLEEACGLPLLHRGKTGASLTPAGKRLLEHARQILSLSDAAYRDMQGVQLAGELHLAITDYFRPTAMPSILRLIRDQFPRLRLHVSIRKSAAIEEEANAGDFDIGLSMSILGQTQARNQYQTNHISLRREQLSWVASKSFSMPEGNLLPLLVLPGTCSLQRLIVKTLENHNVPYRLAHSASGIGGLHLALAAGLGVTCLNTSAVAEESVPFGGLPALPEVEFRLVPPRPGESRVVSQVRDMLAEQLS